MNFQELILLWLPVLLTIAMITQTLHYYSSNARRANDASVVDAWLEMIDPLRSQVVDLAQERRELQALVEMQAERNKRLEAANFRLQSDLDVAHENSLALAMQLRSLGIIPDYQYYRREKARKEDEDGFGSSEI